MEGIVLSYFSQLCSMNTGLLHTRFTPVFIRVAGTIDRGPDTLVLFVELTPVALKHWLCSMR